ncbi:hypothetical protein ACM66B_001304 [Microbotryomycetes sp. NB124-2]
MPPKRRTPSKTAAPAAQNQDTIQTQLQHALPSLPVQHLVPRVVLLVAGSATCLYTAADKSRHVNPASAIVSTLVREPVQFLALSTSMIAVLQASFGHWTRSLKLQHERQASQTPPQQTQAALPRQSWTKSFQRALSGKPPRSLAAGRGQGAKSARDMLDFSYVVPAVTTTLAASLVFHLAAILLGAPFFARALETYLLSLLVSVLAILPIAITVPTSERYTWLRLFSSLAPANNLEFALLAPAVGAIVGCWLGAVPIPLDWDRPWQKWPTTCTLGALAGHAVGSGISIVVCSWRALESSGKIKVT